MLLLIKSCAFVASLIAFIVILVVGVAAAGVPESGARLAGLFLSLAALFAFGCASFLVFARDAFFARANRRSLAIGAALAGLAPLAVLSWAALRFAGLPFGNNASLLDWGAFTLGVIFALGAIAVVALAYRRVTEPATRLPAASSQAPPDPPHVRVRPPALRGSFDADDDVRVTRV